MKYMGSKAWMLKNGLGTLLSESAPNSKRFIDLFSGSAAVSQFVATRIDVLVMAFDLQKFSTVLADAVIGRTEAVDTNILWNKWHERAELFVKKYKPPKFSKISKKFVLDARRWSENRTLLPITKAYGGHYFSPEQSLWIDALRKTLPAKEPNRTLALAALIQAASCSCASPGHTAQPFQPTSSAKKFLEDAWKKDIVDQTYKALISINKVYARKKGSAAVLDANLASKKLRKGDLVFIDPPYSGVHYSRFYHVLETIAEGDCGVVSGVGRYPDSIERPFSQYSVKTHSEEAFEQLLRNISMNDASAIVTFPDHECSNGLSGEAIREIADDYFYVKEKLVESKFSTLGGTGTIESGRAARQNANELILMLYPR